MIIENVVASFPTRTVSNEEVIDLIRFHSKANFEGDLPQALNTIQTFLDQSGLITRQWQAQRERPIDHLEKAVSSVRSGSALKLTDIDLFIYVGVGRGFREPGNSYMAAKALGITRAECFDVIDAGMSWTRALSLVDSLFSTSPYRNALVVNAEFNVTAGGTKFPTIFSLAGPGQVDQALTSYTIGEAATATLLRPGTSSNLSITIHSRPDLAGTCLYPSAGFNEFHRSTDAHDALGIDRFAAKGSELHRHLSAEISHLLNVANISSDDVDIVFTHTSSSAEWHAATSEHGLANKIYDIYPRTGNIVSASIPAAIARAKEEGRLNGGDRVLFLVGSAGMSFAAGRFEHLPGLTS
jgi:3-oxoacyl-[acyl-carrier-protein] synthase III